MRQFRKKNLLLVLLLTCAMPIISFTQSVTGIWSGYFISEGGDTYKLEFQVKQNSSYAVTGVSYSYLDVRFYGKATMTGGFIRSSGNFRIREIKTVEVKNLGYGVTCIMNYDLHYSRSGKEEFLEGTYLGKQEVKSGVNPYKWGDCGGGKVFLRKVTTSNFYVEPFLRNVKPRTNPPITKKSPPKTTPHPPVVKTTPKPNQNNPVKTEKKPVEKKPEIPKTVDSTIVKAPEVRKNIAPKLPTPEILKSRQNELMKSLIINHPDVVVKLYDNGEIDDDTISVYLDKRLVLSNKRLTASPLTIKLKMDEENPDHELVMIAENLGRIPPNTSLMIVEAGDQRFEVRITSTEQKNAMVRFKYEKP